MGHLAKLPLEAPRPADAAVLVDGHAHFHPCFPPERFLASARGNFAKAASDLRLRGSTLGVLALMDRAGERSLERLQDSASSASRTAWSVRANAEPLSLSVRPREGPGGLVFIAGRQLRTREGLEVLAFGCGRELPERLSLEETVAAVHEAEALPIVPWGLGKWSLRRGRLVEQLLERHDARSLFLGDTRHRPRQWPSPRLFAGAAQRGIRVLPGSDPFPFAHQVPTIGSFGFWIEGTLDAEHPAESLKSMLRGGDFSPQGFGERETLLPFLKNQLAMQLMQRQAKREIP